MTRTSSLANVSSMTRWMVTLSSASSNVARIRLKRSSAGVNVLMDELDDLLHRAAGQKDSCNPDFLQFGDVDIGNDPADQNGHVVQPFLTKQFHDSRANVHVSAAQDRQANHIRVFLHGGGHDLL